MYSKQLNADRLSRLAHHLIKNQNKIKKHSCVYIKFHVEDDDVNDEAIPYYLYVMFEMVKIFPKEWYIQKDGLPYWINNKRKSLFSSVMDFLGLHPSEFRHLFFAGAQNPLLFGGKELSTNARPSEIAQNILTLIRISEIRKN